MNHQFEVELPPTLTDDEARLVIEVLEGLIDGLCRHVQTLDRQIQRSDPSWTVPKWMQEPSDTE